MFDYIYIIKKFLLLKKISNEITTFYSNLKSLFYNINKHHEYLIVKLLIEMNNIKI